MLGHSEIHLFHKVNTYLLVANDAGKKESQVLVIIMPHNK
jgi:hypothetical protein